MLRAMFTHWPEKDDLFQPHNLEHLRAWVICKAGRGKIIATEQLPPVSDVEARAEIKAIVKRAYESDERKFTRWKGNTCAVYTPKSIAFSNMGQAAFNALNDEAEAVYEAATGLKVEDVLKHGEQV